MSMLTDKAALIERIGQERALWDALVEEIGEERMEQPGVTGEWTFKDVVVHLIGWRKVFLAQVQAVVRGASQPASPWPAHLDEEREEDVCLPHSWRTAICILFGASSLPYLLGQAVRRHRPPEREGEKRP